MADEDTRPGEIAVPLPAVTDVGVYFVGKIRTPWATRSDCPRSGDAEHGPECTLVIDPRWREALTGLAAPAELQVLYWMHQSRRDLVVQAPRHNSKILGTIRVALSGAAKSDCLLGGDAAGYRGHDPARARP